MKHKIVIVIEDDAPNTGIDLNYVNKQTSETIKQILAPLDITYINTQTLNENEEWI